MHFLDFILLNLIAFLFSGVFGFCVSVLLGIEFKTKNIVVKLTVWIGLGFSVISILGYWLFFIGVSQSLAYFFGILLTLLIFTFYKLYLHKSSFQINISKLSVITIFLAIIYCIVIFRGMYGEYIPEESDFPFHILLVKNIVSENTLQSEWPLFGIEVRYPQSAHLYTALVTNLGNFDPVYSTIAITAFFATCCVLGIYSMTYIITKDEKISFGSFITSAFLFTIIGLSPNSMIYWGGISVVYGLALVPIAIFSLKFVHESPKFSNVIFSSIVCAANVLAHPFSVIYIVLCWVPYVLYLVIISRNYRFFYYSGSVALLALLIASPYLIKYTENFIDSPSDSNEDSYREKRFNEVTFDVNIIIKILVFSGLCIAAVGIYFGIKIQQNYAFFKKYMICLVWVLMLAILGSNIFFKLHMPFWYYLRPKYFLQATFLPLSPLCGYLLFELFNRLRCFKSIILCALLSIFASFSLYYGTKVPDSLNNADIEAFSWLKNQTTQNDVILGDNVAIWMPALCNREVLIMHLPESDDYFSIYQQKWIYDKLREDPNSQEALDALKSYNITYIYMSDASNPNHYKELQISHEILSQNNNFTLIYNKSSVRIYKIESYL